MATSSYRQCAPKVELNKDRYIIHWPVTVQGHPTNTKQPKNHLSPHVVQWVACCSAVPVGDSTAAQTNPPAGPSCRHKPERPADKAWGPLETDCLKSSGSLVSLQPRSFSSGAGYCHFLRRLRCASLSKKAGCYFAAPTRRKPRQECWNTASEANASLWSLLWLSGHRIDWSARRTISIDRCRLGGCPNEFWQDRANQWDALSKHSSMSLDIQFQGRDGFKNTMVLGWIWFHKLLINRSFSISLVKPEQWHEFLRIHLLDGTVSPCLCICAVFTACLPVATSSCLYSFDFVFGHVSQQITSWALLVNHSSMLRHEENLCLFVTYFVSRLYEGDSRCCLWVRVRMPACLLPGWQGSFFGAGCAHCRGCLH